MLTLYIHNISKCAPASDYEYVVMVNAEKIADGVIRNHTRTDGWEPLVKSISEWWKESNCKGGVIENKS